ALEAARRRQNLDTVADRRNRQVLGKEMAHDSHQVRIVAEVLRSSAAADDHGAILLRSHLPKGHVGLELVPRRLDRDVPLRLAVVLDELVAPPFGTCHVYRVPLFLEPEEWVKCIEYLSGIADDQ